MLLFAEEEAEAARVLKVQYSPKPRSDFEFVLISKRKKKFLGAAPPPPPPMAPPGAILSVRLNSEVNFYWKFIFLGVGNLIL